MLTLSIQGKHGLDSNVYTPEVIPLEHDLTHLLSVAEWVHWGFREQDFAASRVDLQLLGKCVVPDVHHIVPSFDDTVIHLEGP